jgi:hypothetical protein
MASRHGKHMHVVENIASHNAVSSFWQESFRVKSPLRQEKQVGLLERHVANVSLYPSQVVSI